MTDWEWFAGSIGDVECEGIYPAGGCRTLDDALTELVQQGVEVIDGEVIVCVVEARSSTAMRYEGAECVPFLRRRNEQTLSLGELHDVRAQTVRAQLEAA